MKKSSFVISLILIMILAISAVSAADNDVTSDLAESQVSDEVVNAPAEDPVVTATDDPVSVEATPDSEVLKDSGDKNFTQLQNEIDASSGTIILDSDYVRQSGESDIVISKNLNILGNDVYVIDANYLGGIFKINPDYSVLLSNVILVNGNSTQGGAIYNEGIVTVSSSMLSYNSASVGGAIYNKGTATVTGSTLEENEATTFGGAIYSEGTTVVDGSTFDENAAAFGSCIYSADGSELSITASNFEGSGADDSIIFNSEGSSLYLSGNDMDYGHIYNEGIITSQIRVNINDGEDIYADDDSIAHLDAYISDDSYNPIVGDESFKFVVNDEEITATCYSDLGYYSADYAMPAATIYEADMISNKTSMVDVETCRVVNKKGTFSDLYNKLSEAGDAGVLDLEYNFTYTEEIDGDDYLYGIAFPYAVTVNGNGYTIDGNNEWISLTIAEAGEYTFNNISFINFGDSVIFCGCPEIPTVNFNDCTFKDNEGMLGGAAIIAQTPAILNINRCTFEDNVALGNGGVIYHNYVLNIADSVFNHNSVGTDNVGGVIYVDSEYDYDEDEPIPSVTYIRNSVFNDNTAGVAGGAIYIADYSIVNIYNSSFTSNSLNGGKDTYGDGDLYNYGGAIAAFGGATLTVTDSNFTKNTVIATGIDYSLGGAIHVSESYVSIFNSIFEENEAAIAGAVDLSNINQDGPAIDDCTFKANSAIQGGAVSIMIEDGCDEGNVLITDSQFIDNKARGGVGIQGDGPAILTNTEQGTENLEVYLTNCNFTDHKNSYNGPITSLNTFLLVSGCEFTGNEADYGAAIYSKDSELYVEDSKFNDNEATDLGGAIFIQSGVAQIMGSTFEDNMANGNPNAIYLKSGELSLLDNDINTEYAEIINVNGTFISDIYAEALDGETVYYDSVNATIYGVVYDDSYNLIYDPFVVFTVAGVGDVAATPGFEMYEANVTLPGLGYYLVDMDNSRYDFDDSESGIIAYITGTYTDLQMKINVAIASGNPVLDLPYDFTYNSTFDHDLVEGIMILQDLTINGNNHYIDANNTSNILNVAYSNVNINDVEFKNAQTIYQGVVNVLNSNLNIDNCTFTNCSASGDGSIIYNMYYPVQLYIVYDEASYDAVLAIEGGPLQKYYEANPEEDVDESDPRGHSWAAVQAAHLKTDVSELPWVVIDMGLGFTGAIYADYGGVQKFGPWNVADKTYGIISVTNPGDMGMKEFALWGNTTYGNASDFKPKSVSVRMDSDDGDSYLLYDTPIDPVVTISNSKFDCGDGAVIENQATLSLQGNTIVGSGYIYNNGGIITSPLYSTVLDNKSVTPPYGEPAILNATLTDDNGNNVFDERFAFTLNRHTPYGMTAEWDSETGLYTSEFAFDFEWHSLPMYVVSIAVPFDDVTVKTGIINNPAKGTFTELQAFINVAVEHNDSVLGLDYDYTYTPEIDGDNFPNGVLINQSVVIIGNGHTITANNTSRNVFTVKEGITATLTNVTITGVNGDSNLKYGAVVNKGNLTIDNCTFKDNAINKVSSGNGGAAVFNTGTSLVISDSRFINNTAPWSGSTGAVSSWINSYLLIENSYFEGNLARFGAAIEIEELDQKEVAVRNCTFFNNSGYSGVSINANANVKYLNVTNCTFDSNNFHGPQGAPTTGGMGAGITAGTTRRVPVTLEVSDCIFKNNSGDDEEGSVGAAIRLADRASGIITNCTFENNYGTKNVAIASGTMNNDSATLTVKDSTFIGNDATNGITVMIDYNIDASIENCDFSADANDIAIYNSGTLSLSKNTIDSVIYNKGTITSETNITVLNNKTVNAVYGEPVSLNATYTDDNGNPIYDPNFKFTVAGVADPIDAVYADGVYTATYKVDKVEEKVVSAELPYDVDTYTGLLNISQANVNLTVSGIDIQRKYNETITVTVFDLFGEPLNLTVEVYVSGSDGSEYYHSEMTKNGTYSYNITGLAVGEYSVFAIFNGNDNYKSKVAHADFIVEELNINGTYTELQKLIDETPEGETLVLPYDFAYSELVDEDNFPEGVVINRPITIDGNMSTISGEDLYRIFYVNSTGVVLSNIAFVNGYAEDGGAIYVNAGASLSVSDSLFEDNMAAYVGGAISVINSTLIVESTDFVENVATEDCGGAISVISPTYLSIVDSYFAENVAICGGAIVLNNFYQEDVAIDDCVFAENVAVQGGAIHLQSCVLDESPITDGYLVIDNSVFDSNIASLDYGINNAMGPAITSVSELDTNSLTLKISNSNVTGHKDYKNGAITADHTDLIVDNCNFTDNTGYSGAAIFVQKGSATISDSSFVNNTATQYNSQWGYGGAVYSESNAVLTVSDSYFINNTAYEGGAIRANGKATVAGTEFTGNNATNAGGAIVSKGDLTVMDSVFVDNKAVYGNAIAVNEDGLLALENNVINTEAADVLISGNAVITSYVNITVLGNDTVDTGASEYYLTAKITDDNGNLIEASGFAFNVTGTQTATIPAVYNATTKLYEAKLSDIADKGIYYVNMTYTETENLHTYIGILRNIKGTYTDLKNIIDAAEEGGTLVLPYNFIYTPEIDGENFKNGVIINKALNIEGDGYTISGSNSYRILYIRASNVNITGVVFKNGNASLANTPWGGAIYVIGAAENVTIADSMFSNNTAFNGGAIYFGGDKGVVNKTTFMSNKAAASGGAIFWYGDDGLITGDPVGITEGTSLFMYNVAENNGGAVAWFTQGTVGGHNGVIEKAAFMQNNATLNGGAVYWESPDGTLRNSVLISNHATQNGGAVFWNAANGNITHAIFSENTIDGALGGAVFSQGKDLTIFDAAFEKNGAANGAAVALFADAEIIDSHFSENVAANYGGAIYGNANVVINGSNFYPENPNTATIGKAIYMNLGELSLADNTINTEDAYVVLTENAVIASYVNATIIRNATVDVVENAVKLNATIVDDKGNLIEAPNFKFVIDGKEIDAVYNAQSKLYEAEYTLPGAGVYPVNMTYTKTENLDTYIGIFRNVKGTYTDLQNLIDAADGELALEYDFTYNAEIDGENFLEGVVIADPIKIEGNGFTISGNNSYRIFKITAATTINNVTFTNGSAVEFGGAIFTTADLAVSNSTFINNKVALNDANGGAIAAIAIDSEINLDVNNVLFKNNSVDNAGGAIAVATLDSRVTYNINDSEFVENYAYDALGASGGAIFSYGNTEGFINNTVFRGNYIDCDDLSNGAAIKLQFGGTLTVANSIFEDNRVNYTGSAISVQASPGTGNVLIVDNCTFTGRSGEYGDAITSRQYAGASTVVIKGSTFDGGIYLDEFTDATISDSTIDNGDYAGIYNLGELYLDNNTVNLIHNNGTITSLVNATFLDNKTISVEVYDEVFPYATLTDDNGNPIYDPDFRITVNGDEITDVEYVDEDNVYISNYTIEKTGDNVVSTSYDAEIIAIYTGIYDVSKVNVTRFEVIPGGQDNRIPYGENVTVYVVLEGIDGVGLNETLVVVVNNEEYTVAVENGTGSFNVSGLAPGQYAALGMFAGNEEYYKAYATGVFTVLEPDAVVAIEIDDITVGEAIVVKVNLTDADGNPIYGTVNVEIGNSSYPVIVFGNGSFEIDGLAAGNYSAVATFIGDASYEPVNATDDFEVKKISDYDFVAKVIELISTDKTVRIEVTLPEDASGEVNITINGETYNATVEEGSALIRIPELPMGDYPDVEVLYSGDEQYAPGVTTVDIHIGPAFPYFTAWIEEESVVYGDDVTIMIEINDDATGTIAVYDVIYHGDEKVVVFITNVTVDEAREGITVSGLNAGYHEFELIYSGDENYTMAGYHAYVEVEKIEPELGLDFKGDLIAGSDVTISFTTPVDVDGEIRIYVNNVEVEFTGEAGNYTVTLNNVSAGTYYVNAELFDDTNYYDLNILDSFEVSKVNPEITLSDIDARVGDTVDVSVTIAGGDATGYILFNGKYYVVENGQATVPVTVENAGMQSISVAYTGDDKYNNGTGVKAFNAGKAASSISADVPEDADVDEDLPVTVTVTPEGATGNYSVFIDGVDVTSEYGELIIVDGKGSFILPGLTAGNHTIGVKYNGDVNYEASEMAEYIVEVSKIDIADDIEIEGSEITYGDTATVTLIGLPEDATGTVTVTINGREYTADVEEGSVVVEIPGLDAGYYEDLPVNYSGDDKYAAYEGIVSIGVVPLEVDWAMEPEADVPIDVNETVTVTLVDVTEGAEGNITITIDGVEYGVYTLDEALVGIELTGFDTPGTYTVEVGFIENPNYEYAPSLIFDVIVDTIDADMNVTVPEDAKVGDTVNITVELPEDAAGEVAVFIDGVEVSSVDVEGGKVIVPVDDLAAGEHNVVVIYSGDDKYDTATEETMLNVTKVDPTIDISVLGDDVTGGSEEVTIQLPEDATNYVLVDVNGMQYFGELVNGKYSFFIDDLQAIEYEIDVTYVGDDKYNKGTSSYNFTVRKATSDIEANLPGEAYVGDFVVVEVTVDPTTATGNYSVFIDGVDVSEQFGDLNIANGKGSFVITALTNGTHTIGVKYNGDSNYEPSGIVEYQIVINKVDVSGDIHIEGSESAYGETATVTFELPDDATGTVTVTVNGIDYFADVDGGVAVVEIPGLDADIYENVAAKYSGDDKYEAYEGNATIEVEPLYVDWFLDNDDIYIDVNDTVILNIYDVTEGAEGSINVTVNGEEYGVYSLEQALAGIEIDVFNAPGEYTVVFAFVDNPNFEYASPVDVWVIVRTIDADMNVTLPGDAEADTPSEITVELPSDATGNVTIIVDGKEVATAPVEDGKATVEVPGLTAGNHTVDVVYSGDDTYSPAIASGNLTVSKADATVVGEADDITVGEDATIIITVPSDAKGVVLVDIDGQSLYGNIVDGKATVTVSGLTAGEKTATITLTSDDKYAQTSNTTTFTVNKVKEYDMTINSTTPREGENATVTVELPSDANGNVTVTDSNGNSVTVPVENGKATVEVPGLVEGENNVTVTYSGDDKYDSKSENTTINVTSGLLDTVLSADKLEMYVGDGSQFQAKLLDENGNPVANRGIKVSICGKTYTIKTNSSGIAVLPINLKAGSYPVSVWFNGDSKLNPSNTVTTSVEVYTKVRITDNKDLVKVAGGPEQFKVRALDKYGKPVGAYAKVKMTISGKTYTVNTDANGYASLAINLKAGIYTITTVYGGTTVTNTITVKAK